MKTRATHFVLATIAILGMQHAAEAQTMRLSIKRVWGGPSGSATAAAPAFDWAAATGVSITQMVTDANTILATAGISLQADPVVDLLDPGYPYSFYDVNSGSSAEFKHAREAACEIDPARFAYRPDAINVYLVNTLTLNGALGGICSFPYGVAGTAYNDEDDVIFISSITGQILPPNPLPATQPSPNYFATTLAHEVGHYFGLFHTYQGAPFTPTQTMSCSNPSLFSCNAPIPADTVGDLVGDTPADDPLYANVTSNTLGYGLCPAFGYAFKLLRNPMANHYTNGAIALPVANMAFTCGQKSRMQQYITARARVQTGTLAPTISSVSPSSIDYISQVAPPYQLTLTGFNFQVPASVDVTIGRIKAASATTSLVFDPEAISATTVTTGTPGASVPATIVATFSNPLPPGLHTVCVRTHSTALGAPPPQTIAFLDDAVEVTPWIDIWHAAVTSTMPPTENFTLVVKAAQPIYGVIGYEIPLQTFPPTAQTPLVFPIGSPFPGATYELLLNLTPYTTQQIISPPLSSNFAGFGFTSFAPPLTPLTNGLRAFAQYAHTDINGIQPPQLSNVIEFVVP